MKEYQVGQILFLIGDTTKIIPIQVIEEVVRTTLDGKEKTYIVKMPDQKGTSVDIHHLKGKVFESKKELEIFMLDNAKNAIQKMLRKCSDMCFKAFDVPDEPEQNVIKQRQETQIKENVQHIINDDIIKVDLGDGKIGKLNIKELDKAGSK